MKLLPALLASLGAATPAFAQTWTQHLPASDPGQRYNHMLTPMPGSATGELVLFGGRRFNAGGGSYLNDTWRWDGTDWLQLSPANQPSTREGFAATFDPVRQRSVVFSGWNGNDYPSDTWEFDGTNWSNATPATSPLKRDWATLTYDFNTGTSILYGGHDFNEILAGLGPKSDTWSWNGTAWTQLNPATDPGPRSRHVAAWDGNTGTVILFGGQVPGMVANDTWSWDGTTWTQLFPLNSPPPRNDALMEWDPDRKVTVLHGGSISGATTPTLNDTWEWNGLDWTLVSSSGPVRANSKLAYDDARDEMVFCGGSLVTNKTQTDEQTWAFTGPSPWTDLGLGLAGALGEPVLTGQGHASPGGTVTFAVTNVQPNAAAFLVAGVANLSIPLFGGTLVPSPNVILNMPVDGNGEGAKVVTFSPTSTAGVDLFLQVWAIDATGPQGWAASNGLQGQTE